MPEPAMQPNLGWYIARTSLERNAAPRCPFAMVDRCPRHFQTVSLFGSNGRCTKLDPEDDTRLFEKWKTTDVWPAVQEDATWAFGLSDGPTTYSNLCPEVSFERFGFFASGLSDHADEADTGRAHQHLKETGAQAGDWRWVWRSLTPRHYTECPLYAPLTIGVSEIVGERKHPIGFSRAGASGPQPTV